MKETNFGLLIPEDTDVPNGPAQIGGNAEKVDALLKLAGAQAKGVVTAGTEEVKVKPGAWTYMPTADKVTGLVVPAKGIVVVSFFGQWTGTGKGRAALCVAGTPVASAGNEGFWHHQAAAGEESSGANWKPLVTHPGGMVSVEATVDAAAPPTTGYTRSIFSAGTSQALSWARGSGTLPENLATVDQAVANEWLGGPMEITLPAGTYELGVKYGSLEGEPTIKSRNRSLLAFVKEFA